MSLACARLLMRAVTASRAHVAAGHTGRLGLAATYARCAPLHSSLIHARRGFASIAAVSSDPVAPASTSSAAVPTASSSLTPLQSELIECIKAQQPTRAERLVRHFETQGDRSDLATLYQWIGCHKKAGDWQGAERVWMRISELGLKPDNHSYRALLQVYTIAGGEQLAKIDPLVAQMQQGSVQLAAQDYERLIKIAHRCKLPAEVRRWAELARAAGQFDSLDQPSRRIAAHPTNRVVFAVPASHDAPSSATSSSSAASSSSLTAADRTTLKSQLQAAWTESDAVAASQLISAFEQRGGHCDVAMLNMWIGCHRTSGDWQGAERVWARISELKLKPDNHSYRALIRIYTNAGGGQLVKIDPLLASMQECGVQFSVKDYAQLIKSAHGCKLPAEVRRWAEMARAANSFDSLDGLSRALVAHPANRVVSSDSASSDAPSSAAASSSAPSSSLTAADRAAVKRQLQTAMTEGDSAAASQLISAFEQRGGHCDVAMLNMWIGCHRTSGDWQGAERVWARISEHTLKPDSRSYSALIQIYTRAGGDQLVKIDPLLAQMQQCDVQLAAKDYQSLIKCAERCKQPTEVRRWTEIAGAAGVFDSLDEASRRIASLPVNRVDSVPASGEAPSSSAAASSAASSSLSVAGSAAVKRQLQAAMTAGDSAAASQSLAAFEQRGGRYDLAMLNMLIKCHDKAGDWLGAERVWARVAELSLQPDSRSYCALMRVYTSAGSEQIAKIDPLLSEMQRTHVQLSARDYEQLLKSAHRCKLPAEVRRWSAAARAAGLFDSLDEASRCIAAHPANRVDSAVPASGDAPSSGSSSSVTGADYAAARRQLQSALSSDDAAAIISAFEHRGGRCSKGMLVQWISSHWANADWQGAERAWARFGELKLRPDSDSFYALIQIYTRAGGEQLAKIEPLLAQMQQSGVPLSVKDYQSLIKCAERCKQPTEVRRWTEMARAAGLFDSMDERVRVIAALPANQAHASLAAAASSSSVPVADSAADHAAVMSQLQAALAEGDSAAASQIISAFEQRGGHCDVAMLNMWIGCHRTSGDWQGAERVWARISELSLKPDNHSYRTLIQVYANAGGEQLAKIDPLLAQMQQSGVPLSVKDFAQFDQICAWMQVAR